MNYNRYLLPFLILFTGHANAWVITADFEQGNVGDKAMLPNPDAFHSHANDSRYASSPVLSGNQSGSVTVQGGDTSGGFGKWGGSWKFPAPLKENDEIWFRVWVYYPIDFNFSSSSPEGMKFMRIHVASANGDNEGYHHNYIKQVGNRGGLFVGGEVIGPDGKTIFDNKPMNELRGNNNTGIAKVTLGQWHAFEQYVKFSSKPGQGIRRTWHNGKLVMEDKQTATLGSSSSISDFIYIWTYWNGGAPKTQTAYIDNVTITSDPPGNTDSNGNLFIGTGNVVIKARPNPPEVTTGFSGGS